MVELLQLGQKSSAESIVQSIFPDLTLKNKYLSYRASGMLVREACNMTGIRQRTVERWRVDDPTFKKSEENLPATGSELANKFVHLEFLRNYRMILEKDYQIFKKSLDPVKVMSDQEHQYLLKARTHYTPQQLQILDQVLGGKEAPGPIDFTKFILERSREVVRVTGIATPALEVGDG